MIIFIFIWIVIIEKWNCILLFIGCVVWIIIVKSNKGDVFCLIKWLILMNRVCYIVIVIIVILLIRIK